MKSPVSTYIFWLLLFGPWCPILHSQTYMDMASFYSINFNNQPITPEGGGVSFVDFNGDGLDDISLASGLGDSLEFYQNTGTGFLKLSSLVNHTNEAKHLIWVDFDNDGDKDLYVSSNLSVNKLYRNDSMNFIDISAAAGISTTTTDTYGAAWGDINKDGLLDLYEVNQVNFGPGTNTMYLNNGNGTFSDITVAANAADSIRYSFAPAFFDYDKDGDIDIFIANDRQAPTTLLQNNGDTTFSNVSVAAGAHKIMDGMCATIADFNNDSWLDVYVTNTTFGNALFSNNGNGTFTEVAAIYDVEHFNETWNAVFFDFDLDGDLDLHVCDVILGSFTSPTFYENVDTIFINSAHFPGDTLRNFSSAIGDINNDGRIDLVSANKSPSNLQLWQHQVPTTNHFLKVELEGVVSNRDGISSWIEVYAGGDRYVRYTHCGEGYLSQNSLTQIIGLGTNTLVDSLVVRWLSGHVDRFDSLSVDSKYSIKEGSSLNPVIGLNGSNILCAGDTSGVNLSLSKSYSSYHWSNGDTTSSIKVNLAGIYYAVVTNSFGLSDTSNSIEIVIDSLSLSGTFTPDTNHTHVGVASVLATGNYPPFTYLWDDPLGQTAASAAGLLPGHYTVLVTDSILCSDTLGVDVTNYSDIGLKESVLNAISYWPSPADQQLELSWEGGFYPSEGRAELLVMDVTGSLVSTHSWYLPESMILDVSDWSNGIYLLDLQDSSGRSISSVRVVVSHD